MKKKKSKQKKEFIRLANKRSDCLRKIEKINKEIEDLSTKSKTEEIKVNFIEDCGKVLANQIESIKQSIERDNKDKWQIISEMLNKIREIEEKMNMGVKYAKNSRKQG